MTLRVLPFLIPKYQCRTLKNNVELYWSIVNYITFSLNFSMNRAISGTIRRSGSMDVKTYRRNVAQYATSMTFFKQIYDEGYLRKKDYELIEAVLAHKYGLPLESIFRERFKLEYRPSDYE